MNIAGIDLNLLHVFDAVMSERNATRAGAKIGMSQPAVSNALNRLRHVMKDDLFVRGHDGMRPTARALELAGPIRNALIEIEKALNPVEFDPSTAERTFTIATADYAGMTLMPYIAQYLSEEAPGVNVLNFPIEGRLYEKLDNQEVEYGLFAGFSVPDRFKSVSLATEKFVCLMRPDNPLAKYKTLPVEEYAAARHLLVSPRGDAHGFVDDELATLGLKRRVVMTMTHFAPASMVVLASDLIVTVPSRFAAKCAQLFDLHIIDSPVGPPEGASPLMLAWHKRLNEHPAHTWFQNQLVRAAADMETHGVGPEFGPQPRKKNAAE